MNASGFCTRCGTPRVSGMRFCAACGLELKMAAVAPPVAAPVADEPVPLPAVAGTRTRPRWLSLARRPLAVLLVVVVAGTAFGASILTRQSTPGSPVLAYVPKDSVAFAEVRLDFPGDQSQKLVSFLAHFPGLPDRSAVDAKIAELLDAVFTSASGGRTDYTTGIKPWFGGDLALSVPASSLTGGIGTHMLVLASVTDPKASMAWMRDSFLGSGTQTRAEYGGVELIDAGGAETGVVGGRVLLLGDPDSVRAAIDTRGTNGLSTSRSFEAARTALTGADLGSVFVDTAALGPWFAERMDTGTGLRSNTITEALARIPAWVALRLRVQDDAVLLEEAGAPVTGATQRTNHASVLAGRLPASTIAMVDLHDVGRTVTEVLDQVRSDPALARSISQLDSAASMIGGLDGLVAQVGDASLVVTMDGGLASVGLVATSTDPEASANLIAQLRDLATNQGPMLGWNVEDRQIGSSTATVISIVSVGTSATGISLWQPAFAISNDLVVFGSNPAFLEAVLGAGGGSSLAQQPRYRAVMDRVGAQDTLSWWVDVAAMRKLGEGVVAYGGGTDMSSYQRDIEPYLSHVDTMAGAMVNGGSADRVSIIATVK